MEKKEGDGQLGYNKQKKKEMASLGTISLDLNSNLVM
jgi:hypothetical protein